jgi:hypothetical protein
VNMLFLIRKADHSGVTSPAAAPGGSSEDDEICIQVELRTITRPGAAASSASTDG